MKKYTDFQLALVASLLAQASVILVVAGEECSCYFNEGLCFTFVPGEQEDCPSTWSGSIGGDDDDLGGKDDDLAVPYFDSETGLCFLDSCDDFTFYVPGSGDDENDFHGLLSSPTCQIACNCGNEDNAFFEDPDCHASTECFHYLDDDNVHGGFYVCNGPFPCEITGDEEPRCLYPGESGSFGSSSTKASSRPSETTGTASSLGRASNMSLFAGAAGIALLIVLV